MHFVCLLHIFFPFLWSSLVGRRLTFTARYALPHSLSHTQTHTRQSGCILFHCATPRVITIMQKRKKEAGNPTDLPRNEASALSTGGVAASVYPSTFPSEVMELIHIHKTKPGSRCCRSDATAAAAADAAAAATTPPPPAAPLRNADHAHRPSSAAASLASRVVTFLRGRGYE